MFVVITIRMSKARKVRESLLGSPRPIPDDPFSTERERISEVGEFAERFESTANEFAQRAASLSQINDELVQTLMGVVDPEKIAPLSDLRERSSSSKPKLEALRWHLQGFKTVANDTKKSLVDRDKKFWDKQHYEDKLNNLTDEEKLDNDFVERNIKKRSQAITYFAETEKTLREARLLAASLGNFVDESVCMYEGYLADFFRESITETKETVVETSNSEPVCANITRSLRPSNESH